MYKFGTSFSITPLHFPVIIEERCSRCYLLHATIAVLAITFNWDGKRPTLTFSFCCCRESYGWPAGFGADAAPSGALGRVDWRTRPQRRTTSVVSGQSSAWTCETRRLPTTVAVPHVHPEVRTLLELSRVRLFAWSNRGRYRLCVVSLFSTQN